MTPGGPPMRGRVTVDAGNHACGPPRITTAECDELLLRVETLWVRWTCDACSGRWTFTAERGRWLGWQRVSDSSASWKHGESAWLTEKVRSRGRP